MAVERLPRRLDLLTCKAQVAAVLFMKAGSIGWQHATPSYPAGALSDPYLAAVVTAAGDAAVSQGAHSWEAAFSMYLTLHGTGVGNSRGRLEDAVEWLPSVLQIVTDNESVATMMLMKTGSLKWEQWGPVTLTVTEVAEACYSMESRFSIKLCLKGVGLGVSRDAAMVAVAKLPSALTALTDRALVPIMLRMKRGSLRWELCALPVPSVVAGSSTTAEEARDAASS